MLLPLGMSEVVGLVAVPGQAELALVRAMVITEEVGVAGEIN